MAAMWTREEPKGRLELVAAVRARHAGRPCASLPASVVDELQKPTLNRTAWARSRGRELLGAAELRSAPLAPLVADQQPLGLLAVGRLRGADPFHSKSNLHLAELAALAAVFLARSVLDRDRICLGRSLGAARRITRAMAEAPSLDQALSLVVRELRAIVDFDMLGVLTVQRLESAVHKAREVDESLDALLSLSRPIALRLEVALIAPLRGEVAEFIRLRAAERAVDVTVEAPKLTARLDRRVLGQVLLNLALNAIDAMRGGGQLTFAARRVPGSELLAITVSDTGSGMGSESLDAIFEPYVTTKLHGTGLGLAATRRMVEEHGGSIEASSEPGRGTTFTILLVEHQ